MIDEEEAYVRIYGITSHDNTGIHTLFVLYPDERLRCDLVADEGEEVHYLFGIDDQYYDGKVKEFIERVRVLFDDEHSHDVIEELMVKGFNYFRANHRSIELNKPFDTDFVVESELGVIVCNRLRMIYDSDWLDNVLNEFFLMGVSVGMSRPLYQVLGQCLN